MNAETVNVKFADNLKSWNKGERLEVPLVLSRESREQSRAMLALLEKRLTDWAK